MGRCIRLLRPEDRQVRLLVREDVVDEDIAQICEGAARQRSSSVEWIGGLPVVEPLNGNGSCGITIIVGERQGARVIGVDRVSWKRISGLLELLGETEWHGGILVENDAAAPVILDESGSKLANGCRREPFGL